MQRGLSLGLFGIFGRSQELRDFDKALRAADLHPNLVPDAVKLTAVKLLKEQAQGREPDPHEATSLRYANPLDGGWAMPTLATWMTHLRAGEATVAAVLAGLLKQDEALSAKLAEMEALLLAEMRRLDDPYRLWNQPNVRTER